MIKYRYIRSPKQSKNLKATNLLVLTLLVLGVCIPLLNRSLPFLNTFQSAAATMIYVGGASAMILSFADIIKGRYPKKANVAISVILILIAFIPTIVGPATYEGNIPIWVRSHILASLVVLFMSRVKLIEIQIMFALICVLSIATIFAGPVAFSIDERNGIFEAGRLRGALGHPNTTGMAGVVAIILSVGLQRRLNITMALGGIVVLSSISLTSVAALAGGLVVYLIRNRFLRLLVFLVGVATYFAPYIIGSMTSSLFSGTEFTGRTGIWQWSVEHIDSSNEVGGLSFFTTLQEAGFIKWTHGHNQFVMDMVTGGPFLAFATFIIIVILGHFALRSQSLISLSLWIVLIIQTMTEIPLFIDYPSSQLLNLTLMIGAILHRSTAEESSRTTTIVPGMLL